MIQVENAREILDNQSFSQVLDTLPLSLCDRHFLGQDLISPHDHPFFDQTAVDGYAFRWDDLEKTLEVTGEIQAGDHPTQMLSVGQAMRIFTGAMMPAGADTVVMQEKIQRDGNQIRIQPHNLQTGANIRRRGEQIKKGEVAMASGTQLNPELLGFAATLGITHLPVCIPPDISIIVTGNEFNPCTGEPAPGKIFESNSVLLSALLHRHSFRFTSSHCNDTIALLREKISLDSSQVLLLTGGASVGDYDFTRTALEAEGFEVFFHGVNQKPGKPLLFARKGNRFAFGLPGNPRAVAICFHIYVLPFLRRLSGASQPILPALQLPLAQAYSKTDGKTHFVSVHMQQGKVQLSGAQASHMLRSFAGVQALAEIPAAQNNLQPGDLVNLHLLC